ncbi:MAG TPA: STAS domain-containing protein [Pseudonocardiaceae bacterium]|nr:STAS domain-containing protein [Pseudonocardiaceae bacterium]
MTGEDLARTADGMRSPLRMHRRRVAGGVVLAVTGEVDLATVDDLLGGIRETIELATDLGVAVLVDLRAVSFLGAAGLRVLVTAYEGCVTAGLALRVIADHSPVLRPLRLTGTDRLLTILSALPVAMTSKDRDDTP